MRYLEILNENGVLRRASCWIKSDGEIIQAANPEIMWHDEEAKKYFPGSRDALGAALYAGWIRSNAAGHHFGLQLNRDVVTSAALRVAIKLVKEVDIMVTYDIEGDSAQEFVSFESQRSAIRYLNQLLTAASKR